MTNLNENDNNCLIKFQDFEGPLDVLCHLIDTNKYDIYDLNISKICDQYLEYLNKMEELNLEIASEFIVMASGLIYLKSRKLLPRIDEKEEEISQDELMRRILEYKKYKEISRTLKLNYEKYSKRYSRKLEDLPKLDKEIEAEYSLLDIKNSYLELLKKNKEKINTNNNNIEKIAISDKYTIEKTLKDMYKELYKNKSFVFNKKYDINYQDKQEIVTAFSGLLELSRRQKVVTSQEVIFGDIVVEKFKDKSK